jgi:arginyl-tRNA synthetase
VNELAKMMKNWLTDMVNNCLVKIGIEDAGPKVRVEVPPNREFGDFSTNAAMVCAKIAKTAPRKLAEKLSEELKKNKEVEKTEIAGPGFINIFLTSEFYNDKLLELLKGSKDEDGKYFGYNLGNNQNVQIEFVSANPTGPLTVGHGRQAVIGDILSSVYDRFGYNVTREYYFNDAGKQMKKLSRSLWVRYNELFDIENEIPEGGYHGEYIIDLAREFKEEVGEKYKNIWNDEAEAACLAKAKDEMFIHIKNTLKIMGIVFDVYFSEGSLFTDGTVDKVKKIFTDNDLIYEADGALWLKVSQFVDEKDKVLIRSDGMPTYFFTDIANHYKKHERGFKRVFDIWGADHHGHIPRMKAAMKALDFEDDFFNVILHQMVALKKDGEVIKMSTRAGNFTTLDELIEMVGKDATRYFYAMVDKDAQLIFDIDLAKSKSMENPVYYVQYAHARICSLLKNAESKGVTYEEGANFDKLGSRADNLLIRDLLLYVDSLYEMISTNSPHKLTNYIHDIAAIFHQYYNSNVFVNTEDIETSNARLNLAIGVKIVIADALSLIGVDAPQKMEQI